MKRQCISLMLLGVSTFASPQFDEAVDAMKEAKVFLSFVGCHRSGHSLVGSLLNAHPNAIIAHEVFLLSQIASQQNRLVLPQSYDDFLKILWNKSLRSMYELKGSWQGSYDKFIHVVGDKCGGSVSYLMFQDFNQFERAIDWWVSPFSMQTKWIHVVRNPFDNIASLFFLGEKKYGMTHASLPVHLSPKDLEQLKGYIKVYFERAHGTSLLPKKVKERDLLTIYHEDFVKDPVASMREMCLFLGLAPVPSYLSTCASKVNSKPALRSKHFIWDKELVDEINRQIEQFPWLHRYRGTSQRLTVK